MRSLGFSLVLAVTPLLLGVALSEAVAQRSRPMMSPGRPGMGMFQPRMFNSSPTSQMQSGGSGMSPMSSGGYSPSQMPYGGYGMSAMPSGDYGNYQTPYGGYDSASSSYDTPAQTSRLPRVPYDSSSSSSDTRARTGRLPRVPAADDIEVSGPLESPPPHRALVRLRLPHTWAAVGFDGKKVDSVGQSRTYVTPELSRPRTFEVTATWKNKGRTIWLMEEVKVKSGEIRTLDFTAGN